MNGQPVVPEVAIEAAARAAYKASWGDDSDDSWNRLEESEADEWRATARAAVEAALILTETSCDDVGARGWAGGVRWAAAEADAQAHGREPVLMVDVTDHLRACADNPNRKTAVPRTA